MAISPTIAPVLIVVYFDATVTIYDVPVIVLVLVVGLALSLATFFMTRHTNSPPAFTIGYTAFAALVGSLWIYALVTEIMTILRALARVWGVSEVILGLTLFAWGNSMVDLLTNTRVAKQGFKNMAVSACLGASTFTLLFGMGFSIAITIVVTGATYEHVSIPTPFALSFIAVVLILLSMMVAVPLQGFKITQSFVIVLLGMYGVYTLVIILSEFGIIPLTITVPGSQCS